MGRITSNGEVFRQNQYTAAHKSLPFNTYLLVSHPPTGQTVVVRINDRCPKNNVLDMTKIAVHALGLKGTSKVTVTTLEPTVGHLLWASQDTLAMTTAEYAAFWDKSKHKRISPYAHAAKETEDGAAQHARTPHTPNTPLPTHKPTSTDYRQPDGTPTDTATHLATATPPPIETDTLQETPKSPNKTTLYDIELCTVGSKFSARIEQGRLPEELQSKLLISNNKRNKELRLILVLSTSRSHAVRTQAELIDIFPESCLIAHEE